MSHPRISIIATFYNAETYLDRCVRSLIAQNHNSFEIVLIDDGSVDGTYKKLRSYANGASIRCYSKQNSGAGSARNYGVEHALGEYISFVDGDDFVSPHYLQSLDSSIIDRDCFFAVGQHVVVYENSVSRVKWGNDYRSKLVSGEEAAVMLMYNEITESPWCKLAKRALYEQYPFPERRYEDVAVAGKHFLAFENVAYSKTPIYAYVMRPGSVVHKRHAPIDQLQDFVWAINEFLSPLRNAYPEYVGALAYRLALECSRAHTVAMSVRDDVDNARELDRHLIEQVQNALEVIESDNRIPRRQFARFALLAKNPRLYIVVMKLFERFIKPLRCA